MLKSIMFISKLPVSKQIPSSNYATRGINYTVKAFLSDIYTDMLLNIMFTSKLPISKQLPPSNYSTRSINYHSKSLL